MPKYLVTFVIPHYGELEVDANNADEAEELANILGPTEADWLMLDDVDDAKIANIDRLYDEWDVDL